MAYFSTCFNCAEDKDACSKRAEIRDGIRGLGITSVKFNCPDRKSRFQTGERVEFKWTAYCEQDAVYGLDGSHVVHFVGTVMHEKKGNKRFAIRVDPDQECDEFTASEVLKGEFISVRPDDMKLIDEPARSICSLCAAYDKEDANGRCFYEAGMFKHAECLAQSNNN